MIIAAISAILFAGGTYLVMQRDIVRMVFGISLLSHGANLIVLATGVTAWREDPLVDRTALADAADPLPQAFVLTAIVISMATTALLLVLSALGKDDDSRAAEDPNGIASIRKSLQTMGRQAGRIPQGSAKAQRRTEREGRSS